MSGSLNNTVAKSVSGSDYPGRLRGKPKRCCVLSRRSWFVGAVAVFQIDLEAIRYCFARHTIRGPVVDDFGKVYIPSSLSDRDDRRAFILREIRHALNESPHTPDRIGIALGCNHSVIRSLRLPEVKASELKSAVRFAGASQVPFAFEDACWDCRITDRIEDAHGADIRALLVAQERERVLEILSYFDELELEVHFVHQDIDALGVALMRVPDFSEDKTYGLINVHRTRTDISIYSGSRLRFMSRGAIGSIAFGAGATEDMMPQLLDNFAEGLTLDIQNSLDYYGAFTSSEQIHKMYLYGDLGYTNYLVESLRSRLQISLERFPVETLAEQVHIPKDLIEIAPTSLPIIASAINTRKLCDLSLPERRNALRMKRFKRTALAAAVFLCVGLLGWWHTAKTEAKQSLEALQDLRKQVNDFQNSPGYIGYRIVTEEILRAQRELTQLTPANENHYLVLKELSAITPKSIRLNYLEFFPYKAGHRTQIAGVARTPETAPETQLAEFISRLEHSPLFANVSLLRHTKEISNGIRIVTFSLDMDSLI